MSPNLTLPNPTIPYLYLTTTTVSNTSNSSSSFSVSSSPSLINASFPLTLNFPQGSHPHPLFRFSSIRSCFLPLSHPLRFSLNLRVNFSPSLPL
ncbi:hypothetical protein Patl1_28239 [Pistacia atlantica]|uniref:Uncharacterized protein n=1 Tax=Pistacia atlantica TaxID=434234 RepID=A0ACC1BD23_9ROSI|nr:hypothetical protein Patl1_28239 [Pistacia atlantica]